MLLGAMRGSQGAVRAAHQVSVLAIAFIRFAVIRAVLRFRYPCHSTCSFV